MIDKPNCLAFTILELNKLIMYETDYDKLQPYFGEPNIQCPYNDTDAFVSSVNTKDITKDLKNLEDLFDFNNFNENHQRFSNKIKNVIGNFKIQTLFKKNLH